MLLSYELCAIGGTRKTPGWRKFMAKNHDRPKSEKRRPTAEERKEFHEQRRLREAEKQAGLRARREEQHLFSETQRREQLQARTKFYSDMAHQQAGLA